MNILEQSLMIIRLASFKLSLMFLVAYAAGLLVQIKNVRVNYTRKINHFFLFFIPALADHYFLKNDAGDSVALINEAIFAFVSFIVFIKPIRTRISLIATA